MSKKVRRPYHPETAKHDEPTTSVVEEAVEDPEVQAESEETAVVEEKVEESATPASAPQTTPVATERKGSGKFVGVTTGLRVQQFQNKLLAENNEKKLSDEQILEVLKAEFPENNSRIFAGPMDLRLSIVHAMRREFNAGVHGGQTEKPKEPILRYNDKGEVIEEPNRRKKAPDAQAPTQHSQAA